MPPDTRRLDELIGTHLDGKLDETGTHELVQILAEDRDARQRFARSLAMDTALPAVARRKTMIRRWWPAVAAIAAAAVLAVAVGLWPGSGDNDGPRLEAGSRAVVARLGADLGALPDRLLRGDVIRAIDGPATILWPVEGTRATLLAESAVELARPEAADKELVLRSGQLVVEAGKQLGGNQLSVRSGRLTAAVVGTRFRVANLGATSTVAVEQGTVAISAGTEKRSLGAGQLVVASGSAPLWVSRPGEDVNALLATSPGARLDAAAWQADRGTDWVGSVRDGALAATVGATDEKVATPQRLAGYARLLPDLTISADVTLARPATLAIFVICRRPDGSNWLGNYAIKADLPAGRHQRSWTMADLVLEKGAALTDALGARITQVAVCAWNQPVGLVVRTVHVGNASAVHR